MNQILRHLASAKTAVNAVASLATILGLSGCATHPTSATPLLDTIAKGDCAAVGSMVNEGLARRSAAQLYVAGVLYQEGYCVDKDNNRATQFFEAARAQPDLMAATEIGLRYALGDGLPQSYRKAASWLCHAEVVWQQRELLPAKCSSPPYVEDTVDAEWMGYLVSIASLGPRFIQYPTEARRAGYEGTAWVVICVRSTAASATVTSPRASGHPSEGPSAHPVLLRATQAAFDLALKTLPSPVHSPENKSLCGRRPVSFKFAR